MIGKTISHYKILEKLGEGGMGVVYRAEDTKLDRVVALKFLPEHSFSDEETKARFVQEAKAASAIDHPNIAVVHDIDEVEGQTFISMAYVDGRSLKELPKGEPVPIQEIIRIGVQAAEGLGAAHKRGIVHRDVKSDNLMLTRDGHVKVMDFGLAKLKGSTGLTKAGQTVGTAYYMSPEQTKGEEIDHRSDIFSLGVVLYELITGRLPFTGDYDPAIAYAIINEAPAPVGELRSDVPAELEGVVARALEKDPAKRYQSMNEVISDLRNLWEGRTSEIRTAQPPRPPRLRLIVPAAAILALAAIVVLKFLPGERSPAVPLENTLAVMYFDNMVDAGDAGRLGEIVANLLITDLSESRFVKVVSSQRLYDILKLLGREGAKTIDRDVATRVAEKARAKWMLLGNIMQTEPYLVVTSQLVEVQNGNIVDSQKIKGAQGEDVFSVVDRLTVEVKRDLELPDEALEEPDAPVALVTTDSPEAYRHYLEGEDYFSKAYLPEAIDSFSRAVEIDSTFAMAWFRLAVTLAGASDARGFQVIDKAVQYSGNVTKKEQYYINGLKALMTGDSEKGLNNLRQIVEHYPDEKEAYFWLGTILYRLDDLSESLAMLNKAVEIDPLYKDPYNMLAYAYDRAGDFEKSIWAINKYIELAPDEANPYDTRGELYAHSGRVELAIQSYERALQIKSDFMPSIEALGHLWLLKKDFSKAREYYQELASSDDGNNRALGRWRLAFIPLHRGQLRSGLKTLDDAIAADRLDGGVGLLTAGKHGEKAGVYRELGDFDAMAAEIDTVIAILSRSIPVEVPYREYLGFVHVLKGEIDKAEEIAESLRVSIEASDASSMPNYWWLKSKIEGAKGDADLAVEYMEKANERPAIAGYGLRFGLAEAYMEAGRVADAVALLEMMTARYDKGRAQAPIMAAKTYYMLGKVYEVSGWDERAVARYEEFLDLWKDADPRHPDVEGAGARLAALKSGT